MVNAFAKSGVDDLRWKNCISYICVHDCGGVFSHTQFLALLFANADFCADIGNPFQSDVQRDGVLSLSSKCYVDLFTCVIRDSLDGKNQKEA